MKLLEIEKKANRLLNKIIKIVPKVLMKELKKQKINLPLSVSVVCVTGKKMSEINFQHRKKNKDTDVLSFESPLFFKQQGILGDLVISKSKLIKQAKEFQHSLEDELLVLLTHGVLHLLGYDHEQNQKEELRMREAETLLLEQLSRKKLSKSLISRVIAD